MTNAEIGALVDAMEVLKRVSDDSTKAAWSAGHEVTDPSPRGFDFGMLAAGAKVAGDAIFDVLNVASNYTQDENAKAYLDLRYGLPAPDPVAA